MSNLLLAFSHRQPFDLNGTAKISPHPVFRKMSFESTNSTVSSTEAEEGVKKYNEAGQNRDLASPVQPKIHFSDCNDIKIGEQQITNVFQKFIKEDFKDPKAILNDPKIPLKNKILFVLAQKWYWGIILTVLLMVTTLLLVNTLMIFLSPSNFYWSQVSPNEWGWESGQTTGLKNLTLPVDKIIITQTGDRDESCLSKRECIERLRELQEILNPIPYNFLLGDDYRVYEARGFQFEGEIPGNSNETGLIVAFIGTFGESKPSRQIIVTFNAFLDDAVQSNLVDNDYDLFVDDQLSSSENGLLDAIKDVDHFYNFLNITTREIWSASEPLNNSAVQAFSQPPARIILSFVGYDLPCTNLNNCGISMQQIQRYHIHDGYNDIRYNFVITAYGVFEGLGWDLKPELDEKNTLSIGFIAGQLMEKPNETSIRTLNQTLTSLLSDGFQLRKVIQSPQVICETVCLV